MKRRTTLQVILAFCLLLTLSACGGQGAQGEKVLPPDELGLSSPDGSTAPQEPDQDALPDADEPEKAAAVLFLPEENGEGLVTVEVQVEEGPQGLLDALAEAGVLPEGITVRSFQAEDREAEGTASLDLSEEFLDALNGVGSLEETMMMACLVNTFLEHYGLESLNLTAEGTVIETGHDIYDYPIEAYSFD